MLINTLCVVTRNFGSELVSSLLPALQTCFLSIEFSQSQEEEEEEEDGEMAAGTLFCLIFIVLVCFSGVQTNIPAVLGQDVILPCKVPKNINITAVEWIRPDQDPEYVLFYRDGHLVPYNQHPSYQNRVDLLDKDMKDGDVSLILKNVTKNDTGRYECRVFEEGKNEPWNSTIIQI